MANTALRRGSQDEGNSDYFTGCPIGGGFMWFGLPDKIPSNCRICDNSTLAISSFAKLYENLGGAWGESGGSMNIPDLRGRFPRGVDGGANRDPDRASRTGPNTGQNTGDSVGSVQGSAVPNITGVIGAPSRSDVTSSGAFTTVVGDYRNLNVDTNTPRATSFDASRSSSVYQSTTEARPQNANVYFVIRVE